MKAPEIFERTRACWPSVGSAVLMVSIVSIVIGLGVPLLSAIMTEKGVSPMLIGFNGTIGGLAAIVSATFLPHMTRYFRVTPLILSMLFLGSITFLCFYFFQNLWYWCVLRFFLHFFMTVLFILSECWIITSVPNHQKGFALSFYSIALGIGFAIGPSLFSVLGKHGIFPFIIADILLVVAAIPIIFSWNLTPCFRTHERVRFVRYIFLLPSATLAVFLFGTIQMGAITLIVPYANQLGYTDVWAGHFLTSMALGNIVLLAPIIYVSNRILYPNTSLIFFAVIGLMGSSIMPFLASNPIYLVIDLFIMGGIVSSFYTISLSLIGSYFSQKELPSANAAFIFCYALGTLLGPLVIGQAMTLRFLQPFGFSWSICFFFVFYIAVGSYQLLKNRFFS